MPEGSQTNDFVQSTYRRMQHASKGLPYKKRGRKVSSDGGESTEPFVEEDSSTWKPPPGVARSRTGTGKSYWDPQEVGTVFRGMIRRRSWQEPLSMGTIIAQWPEIAGSTVSQHCQIESFHGGRLLVRADSSAWAKQLQLLLPQIEKRVAEVVGVNAVKQVVIFGPERPSWKHGKFTVKGKGPRDTYG